MSAVGCLKWFTINTADAREESLALNRYPLSFLNEVCELVGHSSFFLSAPGGGTEFDAFLEQYCRQATVYTGVLAPVGSSLPFETRVNLYRHDVVTIIPPHPSVATWVMKENGVVFLPEVAIVDVSATVKCSRLAVLNRFIGLFCKRKSTFSLLEDLLSSYNRRIVKLIDS